MSIDWTTTRDALVALSLTAALDGVRDQLVRDLNTLGGEYDAAGVADVAAAATASTALTTWQANIATAHAQTDKATRYAESQLQALGVPGSWAPSTPSTYTLSGRLYSSALLERAELVIGITTSAQAGKLGAASRLTVSEALGYLRGLVRSPPEPFTSPKAPTLEPALQRAIAAGTDFVALAAFV
jgi:hypothetical protein